MDKTRSRSSTFGRKALAVLILAVAAWVLLKVVIGLIAGVAWLIAVIIALIGVLWAWNTLRS